MKTRVRQWEHVGTKNVGRATCAERRDVSVLLHAFAIFCGMLKGMQSVCPDYHGDSSRFGPARFSTMWKKPRRSRNRQQEPTFLSGCSLWPPNLSAACQEIEPHQGRQHLEIHHFTVLVAEAWKNARGHYLVVINDKCQYHSSCFLQVLAHLAKPEDCGCSGKD